MAYNILIVDDSLTVRAMIERTLGLSGVPLNEIHHAPNGREALELLQDNWFDLILTDINMPEMDGVAMVRQMSKDGVLDMMPVVVISTEGSETRIEELKALGIRDYIRKPFTPEAVRKAVEDTLGGVHDA